VLQPLFNLTGRVYVHEADSASEHSTAGSLWIQTAATVSSLTVEEHCLVSEEQCVMAVEQLVLTAFCQHNINSHDKNVKDQPPMKSMAE